MKRRAVIVGSEGQDGRLLFDRLDELGYELVGIGRTASRCNYGMRLSAVNILRSSNVEEFLADVVPDELYYLAAAHNASDDASADSLSFLQAAMDVNVNGLANCLEALRRRSPATRLFYAASSHIFKGSGTAVQDENTAIAPLCYYGISKAAGLLLCRYFRSHRSMFASVGIMYNHESPLRPENFVSRKIVAGTVRIKMGLQKTVILGDLNAEVDWGYAADYVEAMRLALMLDRSEEFIVATGIPHSVRDFVEVACEYLGLDAKTVVDAPSGSDSKHVRLVGNSSKIRRMTGWNPQVNFQDMVRKMIDDELARAASTDKRSSGSP